jgi:hypothetical protein
MDGMYHTQSLNEDLQLISRVFAVLRRSCSADSQSLSGSNLSYEVLYAPDTNTPSVSDPETMQ